MKVFITGASGFVGSHVISQLLSKDHSVLALSRSDTADAVIRALSPSIEILRGSHTDPALLQAAASRPDIDAAVHLAYDHTFSNPERAAAEDVAAIQALGAGLGGGKKLIVASGMTTPGKLCTEDEPGNTTGPTRFRALAEEACLALAKDGGVWPMVLRLPPSTHGPDSQHGFINRMVEVAREKGFSGYVGTGEQRWPAVHIDDAARLVVLALEGEGVPKENARLMAIGDEGIRTRDIAQAIADRAGVPTRSVKPEEAMAFWGFIGLVLQADVPAKSIKTKEWVEWQPTGQGLLEEIQSGAYDRYLK